MDGTAFSIDLNSVDQYDLDWISPTATLTLTLLAPVIAGDFNRDGIVDGADYVFWRKQKGQSVARGTNGDSNFDGQVTDADYIIWRAHVGQPAGIGSSTTIPEPTGFVLVMIALISVRNRSRLLRGCSSR
jgi:hypothetical protein